MCTVKTFIVVAVKQKWPLFQLDVNNAFLHGYLDKEVFINLPSRMTFDSPGVPVACKLHKSFYGLRQDSW